MRSLVSSRVQPRALRHSTARATLQSSTQAIHERLHGHPELARLAAGTIGRADYRRVLARSYGFYAVAEPKLDLGSEATRHLCEDLIDLGMSAAAVASLPCCAPLTIGQGPAELIGARYVVLGASLGGTVMARAIAGRASGEPALPVRFLTGMGAHDWKTFAAGLEANLPDAGSRARAAKAATAVFAAYERWMEKL
jgi:heme oxygenase